MNTITTDSTLQNTTSEQVTDKQVLFRAGWSYKLFLVRNGYSPTPERDQEFRQLCKEASASQLQAMQDAFLVGCKTKVAVKAILNRRDGRYDTSMTARVVTPGCKDRELILEALERLEKSASNRIADARMIARNHGAL